MTGVKGKSEGSEKSRIIFSGRNFSGINHYQVKRKTLAVIVMLLCILYGAVTVRGDLVGYWQFKESSGTSAADSSGYSNTGTLYNMETGDWVTGKYNYALDFDGANDYVDCGNDSSLDITSEITIMAWIKPAASDESGFIVSKGDYLSVDGYMFAFRGDFDYIRLWNGRSGEYVNSDPVFTESDEWIHVAVTKDSSDNVTFYKNGVIAGTAKLALYSGTNHVVIGNEYPYYTAAYACFDGAIDEVRIYNTALNNDEILDVVNRLRGDWKFNDAAGSDAVDSSESGCDGTLVNMSSPWVDGILNKDGYLHSALYFDGSDDYVDCGNNDIYNFNENNAFTVSCWIRPAEVTGRTQGIVGKYLNTYAASPYQLLLMSTGKIRISIGDGTNFGIIYSPADCLSVNQWSHVASTYDGNTLRLYIDGKEVESDDFDYTLNSNTASLKIGTLTTSLGFFKGDIDKVKVYGHALSADDIADMQLLSAQPDRNYYTGEDAVAVSTLNITSDGDLDECYLVAKDSQGNTLATNTSPGIVSDLSFATSSLSNDTHSITIELRKNSGERVFGTSMDILKLASGSGSEVKVDLRKRIVLCEDGQGGWEGFFPVGIYANTLGRKLDYDTDGEEEAFDFLSDIGFNTILRFTSHYPDTELFMDLADDYGLKVIDHQMPHPSEELGTGADAWYAALVGDLEDEVETIRDYTNLLAYYSLDEPNQGYSADNIYLAQKYWNTVNTLDPYHPMFMLYSAEFLIPDGDNWTDWSDALGYDVYPRPFMSGLGGDIGRYTAYYAYKLRERCKQDNKVMWFVPLANMLDARRTPIGMSKDHMYCQAYTAVIYGAKGLLYFSYLNVVGQDAWDALETISSQMTALSPALLNGDVSQEISYSPDNYDPESQQFPMVNAAVFKYPNGDYLLLAVNIMSYAVSTTFQVGDITSGSQLYPTSGTLSISNSSFTDYIEAYGIRAYQISLNGTPTPVQVSLDMTAYTNDAAATVDVAGIVAQMRQGKNYMANPCFEEEFNPDIPNFYRPYFNFGIDPDAGQTGSTWYVDDSTTGTWNDGTNDHPSLRMFRRLATSPDEQTWGTFGVMYPPIDTVNSTTLTFSFYAKGLSGGETITVRFDKNEGLKTTFYIDDEDYDVWERKTVTFDLPAASTTLNMGGREVLITPGQGHTVWITGLQVESGSTATTFQDDSNLQ